MSTSLKEQLQAPLTHLGRRGFEARELEFESVARPGADFQWQSGYACFSVSQSNLMKASACVADQEKRHEEISFEDELRLLLNKHHIEFDERYIWDCDKNCAAIRDTVLMAERE